MYNQYPFNFLALSRSIESASSQCASIKEQIMFTMQNGDPYRLGLSTKDYDLMQQVSNSMELVKNLLEACKLHLNQTSELLETL